MGEKKIPPLSSVLLGLTILFSGNTGAVINGVFSPNILNQTLATKLSYRSGLNPTEIVTQELGETILKLSRDEGVFGLHKAGEMVVAQYRDYSTSPSFPTLVMFPLVPPSNEHKLEHLPLAKEAEGRWVGNHNYLEVSGGLGVVTYEVNGDSGHSVYVSLVDPRTNRIFPPNLLEEGVWGSFNLAVTGNNKVIALSSQPNENFSWSIEKSDVNFEGTKLKMGTNVDTLVVSPKSMTRPIAVRVNGDTRVLYQSAPQGSFIPPYSIEMGRLQNNNPYLTDRQMIFDSSKEGRNLQYSKPSAVVVGEKMVVVAQGYDVSERNFCGIYLSEVSLRNGNKGGSVIKEIILEEELGVFSTAPTLMASNDGGFWAGWSRNANDINTGVLVKLDGQGRVMSRQILNPTGKDVYDVQIIRSGNNPYALWIEVGENGTEVRMLQLN